MATFIQSGDPGRGETQPRFREDFRQQHQHAAAAAEFRATLGALGLTPRHAARIFAIGHRSLRRWQDGSRGVPRAVTLVCRLMAVGAVTIAQVERVAASTPARINGRAKAPLRAAPALEEQSASAPRRARTAAALTTAEKVCVLAFRGLPLAVRRPSAPRFSFL